MRGTVARIWYVILGFGSLVAGISVLGGKVAVSYELGIWAYPVFFLVHVLMFAFVLVILIPKHKCGEVVIPSFKRFARFDEERFEKGVWLRIRKCSMPFFILVAMIALGPFFTAILIRFFAVTEKKAWLYGVTSSMIAVVLWVSVYLGTEDWLSGFLQQ